MLSATLMLLRSNQDNRSRAASGPCTLSGVSEIDSEEARFMEILNAHRATLGLSQLRLSSILTKAAHWQAEDMAENGYHSHTDSLGRSTQTRFGACGVIQSATAGENIVWSTTSAQNAFDRWMASSGHKANMERGSFSQAGIARIKEGNSWTWVNTFSAGNDGTSPDHKTTDEPTATPTDIQPTITPTPTGSTTPTSQPTAVPTQTPLGPTATPGENDIAINYSFKLAGIGANTSVGENPTPIHPQRSVPALLRSSGEIIFVSVATYNPSTSLFEGTFYAPDDKFTDNTPFGLVLKGFMEHDLNTSENGGDTPPFNFTAGDIDSSNSIGLNDYIDMVACIKQVHCTPSKEIIDLNDDGRIDAVDLNILLRSFVSENN